jgi:hypothetical protein
VGEDDESPKVPYTPMIILLKKRENKNGREKN